MQDLEEILPHLVDEGSCASNGSPAVLMPYESTGLHELMAVSFKSPGEAFNVKLV